MRKMFQQGILRLVGDDRRRTFGDHDGRVVAIAALKGGVGKTTTAVNLAAALARFHGQRVLLLDLDPQNNVHATLRDVVTPGGRGISTVLAEEGPLEVMDIATPTRVPGLHVTPVDPALQQTEQLLSARIGKETLLRDALEATRTHYDVIVIDCPPSAGNLTLNALVAADWVLIPCDASPMAVQGVHALARTMATVGDRLNPRLDVLGVLRTRYDGRTKAVNDSVEQELRDTYGDVLLPLTIGINTDLTKAQTAGQDIYAYAPNSRGADHYRALADAVATQIRDPAARA